MALTVTEVFTDPPHFSPLTNCYFHNSAVCCLAGGVYRWLRWEGQRTTATDADLTDSQSRIFGTVDQGLTWTLLATVVLPFKTQWDGLFSPNGTRLLTLMRDKGGYAYDAEFSGLAYSDDGGLTWTSAVSQALFESILTPGILAFDTSAFVKLPNTTTVLAFGRYDVPGGPYNVLRSTDNGASFTPFSDMGVFLAQTAVALSATEVIAKGNSPSQPMYSSDGGATWNTATIPSGSGTFLLAFAALGSGVVLAFGRTTSSNLGTIFRSTDSGQTYVTLALIGSETNLTHTMRALSPTTLIVGAGGPSPTILHKWWLSEDTGATWSAATLSGSVVASSTGGSMVITNTGIMLADVDDPPNGTREASIWRGVVDAFVTTTGTCEALGEVEPPEPPEPGGAVLGIRLDCVPILSPAPCPPFCPVDPVGAVAQLIFPVPPSGPGGGWRSALYLLGLVDGTEALTVTPALLTRPSACGATIVNNNCAVVGA